MHRISVVLAAALLFSPPVVTNSRPATGPEVPGASAPASRFELTVDTIMSGPDLVGFPPNGLGWSAESQQLSSEWRKPGEREASTYAVPRGGGEPRKLTDEESKAVPPAPGGRRDADHRRVPFVDDGDIVMVDGAHRREITRTTAGESNPRWIRRVSQITCVRDGNLFSVSLDGSRRTCG
jgi:hypothetical protein